MPPPCFSRLILKLTWLDHQRNRLVVATRESQEVNSLATVLDMLKLDDGVVARLDGELQIHRLIYLRSIRF